MKTIPVPVRWANLALSNAKRHAGSGGWALVSKDVRHALICRELMFILAGQEKLNSEHAVAAMDAVIAMNERECGTP